MEQNVKNVIDLVVGFIVGNMSYNKFPLADKTLYVGLEKAFSQGDAIQVVIGVAVALYGKTRWLGIGFLLGFATGKFLDIRLST